MVNHFSLPIISDIPLLFDKHGFYPVQTGFYPTQTGFYPAQTGFYPAQIGFIRKYRLYAILAFIWVKAEQPPQQQLIYF